MLVLSRKPNESVVIAGGLVTVTVVSVSGPVVRLAFTADPTITIDREEIHGKKLRERRIEEDRDTTPERGTR